jgi:hypothetical protein
LPADARPVNGHVFSRGRDGQAAAGEHLGIAGTALAGATGRLMFSTGGGGAAPLVGRTVLGFRRWHQVVLVREGAKVRVFLDGNVAPELEGTAEWTLAADTPTVFVGGRSDNAANFEGRIDEVAVFERALSPAEIATHFQASGRVVTH